ncbi:hypothetical protein CTEN210_02820 [Chaetoceros tenuissimus]|uniref:RING-type E3 ubiquitin transferase n=1 Tax=Chaetoceros tenuissimus TaxID=426638 RepID=A0AAD3CI90_9STRA|nr:hypothetical protein CTEN210_02820 [Chaetoceros tenuissimus]
MKSNFYGGGTALHVAVGSFAKQEIIELLLRVGGLELFDITDGGGFRVLDYCDAPEREVIVNSLVSIEKNSKLCERDLVASLEQRKRFSSSAITPREVENWIHQGQLDLFRDHFNNTNVSKAEKIRCLNYRDVLNGRNLLHTYSSYCYPVDIGSCVVNLMDEDYLFYPDDEGNTCLHLACTPNIDQRKQLKIAKFLIDNAGTDLIHVVNGHNETALHKLISSYCLGVMNLDLIKMMIESGDDDLLLVQNSTQCSVLHYISMYALGEELLVYLVSKGGRKLRELTDHNGKKAEDYWTDDVKEYINLSTNTLPSLSDDIQCPICFDTMFDVTIITRRCHRFCGKCISESYHRSGNNCPVCRMEFSVQDLKKDPLLSSFANAIQEEKDAKNLLEEEVKALR